MNFILFNIHAKGKNGFFMRICGVPLIGIYAGMFGNVLKEVQGLKTKTKSSRFKTKKKEFKVRKLKRKVQGSRFQVSSFFVFNVERLTLNF
jgi:hypothetical protein